MIKNANKETKQEETKQEAPAQVEKEVATYIQEEPNMIKVKTTGDFELYDVRTRNRYTKNDAVEVREGDPFVKTHMERKNLKKA